MRLVLHEASVLKNMVSVVAELVNECHLTISKDKVQILAMDPANVSMTKMIMRDTMFQGYLVENEEIIGINLANLHQILKRASVDSVLTMTSESSRVKINMKGTKVDKTFTLPMIDIEGKAQQEPKLTFYTQVTMPSDMFSGAIDDAGVVSESMQFITSPDKFVILAQGDLNSVNIDIPKGEDTKVDIKIDMDELKKAEGSEGKEIVSDRIAARYSLEYLQKMTGGSKIADTVSLRYKRDHPILIEYTNENYELGFILAPRVEND